MIGRSILSKDRSPLHALRRRRGDSGIASKLEIEQFSKEPGNPFLVSFPRTGSHWLRLMLELYFERPLLTRSFNFPHRRDYLLLHTHDLELSVQRDDVIYLYRDPVDTIYSQLCYHAMAPDDQLAIVHWSVRYACHLVKWLILDKNTKHKTVLRYDRLKSSLQAEFATIAAHFGAELDPVKLSQTQQRVTRKEVKRQTTHDQQVVNTDADYDHRRLQFRASYHDLIWQQIRNVSESLSGNFTLLETFFADQHDSTIANANVSENRHDTPAVI